MQDDSTLIFLLILRNSGMKIFILGPKGPKLF